VRPTHCLRDFKSVGELTKKYANFPDSYIKRSMEKVNAKEKKYEIPLMKKFLVGCMENTTKQSSLLAKDC